MPVRILSSMGTIAFSFLIARSRSCSCIALASLASVNNCFEEVIADLLHRVQSRRKQRRQAQKGFATQVRRLRDRHGGTLRGKHPYWDLQSLTRWIHDHNRTIAPLGVANSLENSVAERMERREDLYAPIFRAQGIVGADGIIRMFIASFPPAASRPTSPAADSKQFRRFLRQLFRKDWVVYAKNPFRGPAYVLQYLARYTHRVAISNHRLISFEEGKVTFRYKDYAHGNKRRKMTLTLRNWT
jgi:hypothetical protein